MAEENAPTDLPSSRDRMREARRAFLISLAISVVVIVGYEIVEPLVGATMAPIEYGLIARIMPPDQDPPVVVLDIGALNRTEKLPAKWSSIGYATPRLALRDILKALVAQSPAAIGVDIDFSADDTGFLSEPDDRLLFDSVLPSSSKVPVFLGVARSPASLAKETERGLVPTQSPHWLGDHRYDALAASLEVPLDTLKLVETYSYGPHVTLPTMSLALAGAFEDAEPLETRTPTWPAWLALPTTPWRSHLGYSGAKYVVDYSAMPAIVRDTIATIKPATIDDQGSRFTRKMVLVGDASPEAASDRDSFALPYAVPGIEGGRAILPGIYFHAAGAYTLVRPLYELTPFARTLLDVLLCVGVLTLLLWIRLHYAKRTTAKVAAERLARLGFGFAAAIVLFGVLLMRATRLVWEDWLLVVLVIVAHPSIERRVVASIAWFRTRWPALSDRIALEEPPS